MHARVDDATVVALPGTQRLREELRADIREGDQETRRYMRVLHEDVIARIAAVGEGRR